MLVKVNQSSLRAICCSPWNHMLRGAAGVSGHEPAQPSEPRPLLGRLLLLLQAVLSLTTWRSSGSHKNMLFYVRTRVCQSNSLNEIIARHGQELRYSITCQLWTGAQVLDHMSIVDWSSGTRWHVLCGLELGYLMTWHRWTGSWVPDDVMWGLELGNSAI